MPFATRQAAINAVQAQAETLAGQASATVNAQLAAFMKARPEFEDAGVSTDGCAWGRFIDGRVVIVANNRPVPSSASASVKAAVAHTRAVGTELPGSKMAKVFNAMGPAYGDPTPQIESILNSGGYSVTTGAGGVEDFRAIQGDGVVYINVHAGSGIDRKRNLLFATWTGEQFSRAGDQRLADDLSKDRVVYMLADVRATTPKKEWHYAITAAFVSTYMKFAPNSILFSTGCFSDNADFKQACFSKGLQVYCGWNEELDDTTSVLTSRFFFDRLLSTNQIAPLQNPVPAPPDWGKVQQELATATKSDGLTFDTGEPVDDPPNKGSAKLVFSDGKGSLGTLVPSIASLTNNTETVTLTGIFGSTQGSVLFDNQALQVKTWTSTQIVALSPDATGNLQVKVNGLLSNVVVLNAGVCGAPPAPPAPAGNFPPTVTLNKTDYKAGDTLTATIQIPAIGGGGSTWLMAISNNSADKPVIVQALTVDGAAPPIGSVTSVNGFVQVTGKLNAQGAAETHVLTFKVKTPLNASNQPETQCAGGLTASNAIVGPYAVGQVFTSDGAAGIAYRFFNAGP